jgi:hypothetical protein
MSRLLRCLAVVATLLVCVGCGALGSSKGSSLPFGKHSQDESLRKQVEADSFPTATQAGV